MERKKYNTKCLHCGMKNYIYLYEEEAERIVKNNKYIVCGNCQFKQVILTYFN